MKILKTYKILHRCNNCGMKIKWGGKVKMWFHEFTLKSQCGYRNRPFASPLVKVYVKDITKKTKKKGAKKKL